MGFDACGSMLVVEIDACGAYGGEVIWHWEKKKMLVEGRWSDMWKEGEEVTVKGRRRRSGEMTKDWSETGKDKDKDKYKEISTKKR